MRSLLWLVVAACSSWSAWSASSGCSGGAGPGAHPAPPTPGAPAAADPGAPGEQACDELITHAVALGIDEQAAHPTAPQATAADHEAIRRSLRDEYLAGCRALSREAYRCAMAATTLAQLSACQRTPINSTSNRSVAPAGMTPPAPRSP